jgi:hypothetical protein
LSDLAFDVLKKFYIFALGHSFTSLLSLSFYFSTLPPTCEKGVSPDKSILVFDPPPIEGLKYRKALRGCQADIIQGLKSPFPFKNGILISA